MRTIVKAGLLAAGFCAVAGYGKNAATLIQQFDAALPSGTEARMVWGQLNGTSNELWCIDSRDGIARKIDVGSFNDVMNPQLTSDATRIVFYNQGSGKVQVVNWNGSGLTAGFSAGGRIEDYWKDPAGSAEYVILYNNGYSKMNIATGATTALCTGGVEMGDDGARMSPDGTRVAAFLATGGVGLVSVPACAKVASENCGSSADCGCIANIAPDNTYRFSRQISGHKNIKITGSGTITGTVVILPASGGILGTNTARTTCVGADPEFEQTRWVHPEVFTFYIINLPDNPYIFNIATKNWVSIQDNMGCFTDGQSADAIVSAGLPTNVSTAQKQHAAPVAMGSLTTDAQTYSLDGRLIRNAALLGDKSALRGVAISRSSDGVMSKVCR